MQNTANKHFTTYDFQYADPVEVFAPLRDLPFAMLMHGKGKRWSYICAQPLRTIIFQSSDEQNACALDSLDASLKELVFERPLGAPPFCGGWAGLMSYEYGRQLLPKLENGPAHSQWPDLALALYDQVLAFDHEEQKATLYIWDWAKREGGNARDMSLQDVLQAPMEGLGIWKGALSQQPPEPREKIADYENKIARTVAYIHAGDCFQSNISQAFDFRLKSKAHPYHLIKRLNQSSAAPFSSYFRLENLALASNSPERFLKTRRGIDGELYVSTKPIKGTRPRGDTPEEDVALASQLLASEKDLAENLMIVDLMRNDLSKVCVPGSVKVPKLSALESYANVHHLVSTVVGRVLADKGVVDLLRASFPGGSITGAPKIRAMQIIAELEDAARGPYCGSLLWISPDGCMDSSILIRSTAFVEDESGWRGEFRVGGGIVADSDPTEEYLETIDKGRALVRALTDMFAQDKRND